MASEKQQLELLRGIKYQLEIMVALMDANIKKTIDKEKVKEIIKGRRRDGEKFIKIYNCCDGKNNLTKISVKFNINKGNISRAIDDWEQEGLLIKLEKDGNVYPKALTNL
jgi:predicted transcriptional regulator